MNGKYRHVIDKFNQKLASIQSDKRISLKKSNEGIHLCNNALYLLKEIVEKHGFENVKAEIQGHYPRKCPFQSILSNIKNSYGSLYSD